ncbi:ATP-binding protein [Cerasicoccus frondis]|uniref:ATP-binding protein n=1 Tax=Cerasicoccus frondis TaxID=490090 RepID=UPI0028527F5C|nr:ATP-binding protein [Cerasicoccus frondis]
MESELDPKLLTDCDKEPIHLLGGVQPHGVMMVLDAKDYRILRVSANVADVFGIEPDTLLGQCVLRYVEDANRDDLIYRLSNAARNYANPMGITLNLPRGKAPFDCIGHFNDGDIVLEFENPGERAHYYAQGFSEHYELTQKCLSYITGCDSMVNAAHFICEQVREATGFDRVMFYRFEPEGHGEVVGEAKRGDLEAFLGLHYPATDIPRQARKLYQRNWIRLIYDIHAEPAALLPADLPIMDMSDCVLRSVSPVHIQYLKNMDVTASMSVSLMNGPELWGLIACHHYSGPMFVPYTTRLSCVYLGQLVSAQMATKLKHEESEQVAQRRHSLIALGKAISDCDSLAEALQANATPLLKAVRADGFTLWADGATLSVGTTPEDGFFEALKWGHLEGAAKFSQSIQADFPVAAQRSGSCAGLAMLPLGADWKLTFYRVERVQEIRWAGRPEEEGAVKPLTPRNSFEEWKEMVKGQSEAWTEADVSIVEDLQSWLMAFVIKRNDELNRLNDQLLAKNEEIEQFTYSVSHDLKSPLVTIKAFSGALMEDVAKGQFESAQDNLQRIQRASDRMAEFIEELLAFSRIGAKGKVTAINLDELVSDILVDLEIKIREAGAEIVCQPDLPDCHGCYGEISRLFQNLVDNALKYGCTAEKPRIEILGEVDADHCVYRVRDNGAGIKPKYHQRIFRLFQRLDSKTRGSGVGLASVLKIAQRHGGSCGVISEPGEGAEFWIKLPVINE